MKRFFTPEHKKVIFLDMNRTLLDPDRSFDEAFLGVLKEFTGRWEAEEGWTPETVLQRYRLEWKAKSKTVAKNGPAADKLKQQILVQAMKSAPISLGEGTARAFMRQVQERQELTPFLYPGVKETLESLERHYLLAIISNGSRQRQEKYLARLGLDGVIPSERLFTFQKGGMRKPQPAIFEHALHSMEISPAQGVMVGNSWKNDVLGAAGVGMDAVWIHPAHAKKSSQRRAGSVKIVVIRRFQQLADIF